MFSFGEHGCFWSARPIRLWFVTSGHFIRKRESFFKDPQPRMIWFVISGLFWFVTSILSWFVTSSHFIRKRGSFFKDPQPRTIWFVISGLFRFVTSFHGRFVSSDGFIRAAASKSEWNIFFRDLFFSSQRKKSHMHILTPFDDGLLGTSFDEKRSESRKS